MKRRVAFPKNAAERIRDSQAALTLYAPDAASVPDLQAPAKPASRPPKVYMQGDPRIAPESELRATILKYLQIHSKVAWVGRFNSGAVTGDYHGVRTFIRFSTIRGLSDIGGMLKGGRALWVECKRKDGRLTKQQAAFIGTVNEHGGLAFVATCIEDVDAALRRA